MSNEQPTPNPAPDPNGAARVYNSANTGVGGEGVAEQYVERKLKEAKASLLRTQIASAVLALVVCTYFGVITAKLRGALEPTSAATIAKGLVQERVDEQGPVLVGELKKRVPAMIADLPSYALREIPKYRESLENQIESDMQRYFKENSVELGKATDELLTAHKDDISKMLEAGQDAEATKEVGAALEEEFVQFLQTTDAGSGETITGKLDASFEALEAARKRMAKLAENKNLTPEEKQARKAIAMMAQAIESKRGS